MTPPTLSWDTIDDVLLDMDGTLLDLAYDNHFWTELLPTRFATRHGLTPEEGRARLQPVFDGTRGTLDWYCLDFWSRTTGLDVAALKRESAHRVQVLPETLAVLAALQARRKRLWLVTNAHPEALAVKLERVPLAPYFTHIVSSHAFGAPKEQAAFWRALQSRYAFQPTRSLFVDDSAPVLQAARDFGIAHVVAAGWPDRTQAPRTHDNFPVARTLGDLLPSDSA